MLVLKKKIIKNCKIDNEEEKIVNFKKGEKVYYKNVYNNECNWIEAIIVDQISKTIIKVNVRGSVRTAHVSQLKKNKSKCVTFGPDIYIQPNGPKSRSDRNSIDTSPVLRRSERIKSQNSRRRSKSF